MIAYLKDGWFMPQGRRLRDEVIDGAIDTASMFFRAAVPPEAVSSLALRARTLAVLSDLPHRRLSGPVQLRPRERTVVLARLQGYTDRFPVLQGFVADAVQHVRDAGELRALYLHLMHVSQMMQLLVVARIGDGGNPMGLPLQQKPPAAVAPPVGTGWQNLCQAAEEVVAQVPPLAPARRASASKAKPARPRRAKAPKSAGDSGKTQPAKKL